MPPTPPPYFAFPTNLKYSRFRRFFLTFVLYFLPLFLLSGPVASQGAWEAAGRRNVEAWDRGQGPLPPIPRLHWSRGPARAFSRSAWGGGWGCWGTGQVSGRTFRFTYGEGSLRHPIRKPYGSKSLPGIRPLWHAATLSGEVGFLCFGASARDSCGRWPGHRPQELPPRYCHSLSRWFVFPSSSRK